MIGTTLSHFRITAKLGEGGMGEVYRAEDLELKRTVALKVLPDEFACNEERLQRFRREAQALAALDHPNIVAVFSLEHDEGVQFITLGLVDGQDLAERIPEGGMSFEEWLRLALPLTDALATAHENGVIHRDLKPANVMVTKSGHVKVLDFGLAKLTDLDPPTEDDETLTEALTAEGTIMGTVAYMSPEQAEGKSVDARSDLFSLGALLYEMATGRRAFPGNSQAATLSAVLRDEPDAIKELRTDLPQGVSTLVSRCLVKAVDRRIQTARELHDRLSRLREEEAAQAQGASDSPPSPRHTLIGRDNEWKKLIVALESTVDGSGGLVLIGGEPGVGKTRLATDLLRIAHMRGLRSLAGHCYEEEEEEVSYTPFVEAFEELLRGISDASLRAALADSGAEVGRLLPELHRRFQDLGDPVELPQGQQQRYLFNSLVEFLERVSRETPLVILLDDLHWSDDTSLKLLQYLARRLANLPILLLGTYRDTNLRVGQGFAATMATLVRQHLAQRVALKRLPRTLVAGMLEALGGANVPEALVDAIYHETEGNPFFVEEIFQHLKEEGELFDLAGHWRTDLDSLELDVPEGVKLVIGRRLGRLSPTSHSLLVTAGVVGRRFNLQLAEAVADLDSDDFLDAIEEAEEAHLIRPSADGVRYTFAHELIRQTLLDGISLLRLQRQHLRVADTIEELHREEIEKSAASLAHHLYHAGALAPTKRLARASLMAGEQALASFAYKEALVQFERGLSTDSSGAVSSEVAALWLGQARAQAAVLDDHQREAIVVSLTRAFEAYAQLGDLPKAVEAAAYPVFITAGRRMGVGELLERALALTDPGSLESGRLLNRLGWARSQEEGDYEAAVTAFDQAIEIAERFGDAELRMATLTNTAFVNLLHLKVDRALAPAESALDLARELENRLSEMTSLSLRSFALMTTGRLKEAKSDSRSALTQAKQLGEKAWLSTIAWHEAALARLEGDWQSAKREAGYGLEVWPDDARQLGLLAMIAGEVGDFEKATSYLEVSLTVMKRSTPGPTDDFAYPPMALAAIDYMAGTDRWSGRALEVGSMVLSSPSCSPFLAQWASCGLALVAVLRGNRELAAEQYAVLTPKAGTLVPGSGFSVDRLLALLGRTMGRLEETRRHFDTGLDLCRELGSGPELAWSLVESAELLGEDLGDQEAALARLKESRAIAERLDMKPVLERARRLQQSLGD